MKCSTIPRLYTLLGTGCQCTLHSMSLPYRYVFLKPDLQCSVILRFRPPIPKASTSYTCDKNCRPFLQHCMWLAAIHSKLAAIAHQCPCIMPPSFESQEPKEDSKKTSHKKSSVGQSVSWQEYFPCQFLPLLLSHQCHQQGW